MSIFSYLPPIPNEEVSFDIELESFPGKYELQRTIVAHYAPFFRIQGMRYSHIADKLMEISEYSDQEFSHYFEDGRGNEALKRITNWGRTSFRVNSDRYYGTAWDAEVRPLFPWIGRHGYYYWGINQKVISALQFGALEEIIDFPAEFQTAFSEREQMHILLDDNTAISWSSDMEAFLAHD